MMDLPEELLCEIMYHLPQGDLGRLTRACKDLYRIGSEDGIWKKKGFLKRTAETAFAGSDAIPTPRLCHTAAVYKGKMYVFGGHNTEADSQRFSEVRNDLYAYDFAEGKWGKAPVKNMCTKTEHSTVIYNDKLFMFGGYSGHMFTNTLYMLNLATPANITMNCALVKHKGDIPAGRSAHVGVVYEGKYYMFGGWDGVIQNNDFYSLDLETMVWNRIESTGPVPPARCSHTATLCQSRRTMYVFGGFGGEKTQKERRYMGDIWAYQFDTQTWTELKTTGRGPSPRSRMRMVEWDDKLYVFGGWDKTKHFDELYEFDTATCNWTKVDFGEGGDPRLKIGQFSMSLNGNILYLFGGYSAHLNKSTNDLFCLRLGQPNRSGALESSRPPFGSPKLAQFETEDTLQGSCKRRAFPFGYQSQPVGVELPSS